MVVGFEISKCVDTHRKIHIKEMKFRKEILLDEMKFRREIRPRTVHVVEFRMVSHEYTIAWSFCI